MAQSEKTAAVGAGTKAGGAAPDERAIESRAAQAVGDDQLESIRTTGAAPTGVPSDQNDSHHLRREAVSPEAARSAEPGELPATQHDYAERPRGALKKNQAGI